MKLRNQFRAATLVTILFAIPGLAFNIWPFITSYGHWGQDYNQFYSASRLAGTGHLYDWDALRKIELERTGEQPVVRLPVVAYCHKVLGALPYDTARATWLGLSVVALVFFAVLWPGVSRRSMLLAVAWSMPASINILCGQDVTLWVLFFAAGLWLIENKRPWSAGVALSLCICKFHLALGIPVMLIARKRWKTLIAGLIAVLVWIAASFVIEGPAWPRQYLTMFGPLPSTPERMPNLHGIVSWTSMPAAAEVVCAILTIWLCWSLCRRSKNLGMAGAAAAACGLLVGHHAFGYDCTLLIPLAVLTLHESAAPLWLKGWAVLNLSPVPVMLMTSNNPLPGQLLIVGFAVAAMGQPLHDFRNTNQSLSA